MILLINLLPHEGTVLARLAVFPVIVKGQREAAKLNNVLPEMTKLTNRMNEAKQSGNKFDCKFLTILSPLHLSFEQSQYKCACFCPLSNCCSWAVFFFFSGTVAKAYSDLNLFQKKHDVNPLRGFLVPLVQVGILIYFYICLCVFPFLKFYLISEWCVTGLI